MSEKLMVQFACGGTTLYDRKRCTCYTKDEQDKDYEDCLGLKRPDTGVRDGHCWNSQAMLERSYTFLKFCNEQIAEIKPEQSEESYDSEILGWLASLDTVTDKPILLPTEDPSLDELYGEEEKETFKLAREAREHQIELLYQKALDWKIRWGENLTKKGWAK